MFRLIFACLSFLSFVAINTALLESGGALGVSVPAATH